MANDQSMSIRRLTWHQDTSTVEFELQSNEAPPRPDWIADDRWYGAGGDVLTFSVPAKKATATASVGIGITGVDAVTGMPQFTKYTWNGTAWVNPVRCDGNGNPL